MALATSYNLSGIREDLQNWLSYLEPEDTPKTSSFSKGGKVKAAYETWQADTLANVNMSGVLEGQDVSAFNNKAANRARFGGYVQKFREAWMVSDMAEASDVAGVDSEVANAKVKSMREIKRSIEAAIGSDNDTQADNGIVPYKFRGLGEWIKATAQTTSPVPTAFLTPAGNIDTTATGSLTETLFNDVFTSIFTQVGGRRNSTLFAGPLLKRAISKFQRAEGSSGTTKSYQVTQDATDKKVTLNVSVYDGDFHNVTVVPDLFNGILDGAAPSATTAQQKARGYVIDPALVSIGSFIPMHSIELENQGGGRRGFVEAVLLLQVKNPRGLGKFAGSS